jgi:hypothetical protein
LVVVRSKGELVRRVDAWQTSSRTSYESSSAASDIRLAPFGLPAWLYTGDRLW